MKYDIIEELGRGANGAVYLVKNIGMDRLEVLKTLSKEKDDGEGVYNELILQRLAHPNIPKIYYHDETPEAHLIYYEYIENTTDLYKFISSGKSKLTSLQKKNNISKKIIDALHYIHLRNFVHADIKPQNILINQRTYEPYLIDFDLSCEYYTPEGKDSGDSDAYDDEGIFVFDDSKSDKARSASISDSDDGSNSSKHRNRNCNDKKSVGTPYYISPYTLTKKYTTKTTDVYNLGYTLLCLYLDEICPPWDTCKYNASELYEMKNHGSIKINGPEVFNTKNKLVATITPLPLNIERLLNYMMSKIQNEEIDYTYMFNEINDPIFT